MNISVACFNRKLTYLFVKYFFSLVQDKATSLLILWWIIWWSKYPLFVHFYLFLFAVGRLQKSLSEYLSLSFIYFLLQCKRTQTILFFRSSDWSVVEYLNLFLSSTYISCTWSKCVYFKKLSFFQVYSHSFGFHCLIVLKIQLML